MISLKIISTDIFFKNELEDIIQNDFFFKTLFRLSQKPDILIADAGITPGDYMNVTIYKRGTEPGFLNIPTSWTAKDALLAIYVHNNNLQIAEPAENSSDKTFTKREQDVLAELSKGITNKEIAYNLGITERTVKFHLAEMMKKMNAESRTELVMEAAKRGLIAF
jgi:DNA-binding CsgD family transcriptional regulator